MTETEAAALDAELERLDAAVREARGRYLGQLRANARALDLAPLAIELAEAERQRAEALAALVIAWPDPEPAPDAA